MKSCSNVTTIQNESSGIVENASDVVEEKVVSYGINPKFCVTKIKGLIDDKCALMLVDTGSTVSIVNDSLVERGNVSKVSNVSITSPSGDEINIIGKVDVNFNIGNNYEFVYNVYVATHFSYQCIIGLDVLRDFACNIDLGNNYVVFNDEELITFESVNSCDKEFDFQSMNGIEIVENKEIVESFNVDEGLS